MIKKIKQKLVFSGNLILNNLYQKLKYNKKYLISVSTKEILKHEGNFYEKQIENRKEFNLSNSFNLDWMLPKGFMFLVSGSEYEHPQPLKSVGITYVLHARAGA